MTQVIELSGAMLARANDVYASLAFVPSRSPADRTFGVLEADALVALGRINRHPDGSLEIGGFWVREDRRGAGLARRVVRAVIDELRPGTTVYCIPFAHLTEFYRSFGMQPVSDTCAAPASIRARMDLCAARTGEGVYRPTDLLVLRTPPGTDPEATEQRAHVTSEEVRHGVRRSGEPASGPPPATEQR